MNFQTISRFNFIFKIFLERESIFFNQSKVKRFPIFRLLGLKKFSKFNLLNKNNFWVFSKNFFRNKIHATVFNTQNSLSKFCLGLIHSYKKINGDNYDAGHLDGEDQPHLQPRLQSQEAVQLRPGNQVVNLNTAVSMCIKVWTLCTKRSKDLEQICTYIYIYVNITFISIHWRCQKCIHSSDTVFEAALPAAIFRETTECICKYISRQLVDYLNNGSIHVQIVGKQVTPFFYIINNGNHFCMCKEY